MADASQLFDLAGKISIDNSQSDRVLTETQKRVVDLEKKVVSLEKKVVEANKKMAQGWQQHNQSLKSHQQAITNLSGVIGRDLQGAVSTLLPGAGALFGAAGPFAIGALVVAGLSKGIVSLATHASAFGSKIHDASQKVNFTTETLSALKVGAELSGGSFESLTTALGLFDKNLEEAHDKTSEQSKIFKALKIDINDNEKALRQAFAALIKTEQGYQQTALAMKLFGRSGKEVLGIIKETGGDIDGFIAKMTAMGLVIDSQGAKKADEFGDKLTILQGKFDSIIRMIGTELMPVVARAADDALGWLQRNQGELQKTAKDLATVVEGVYKLAKIIADSSPFVITVRIIRSFSDSEGVNPFRLTQVHRPQRAEDEGEFAIAGGAGQFSVGAGPPRTPRGRIDLGGGGGGSGGGGGAKKDILQQLKAVVTDLSSEYRKYNVELLNSANASAEAAEKEKILSAVMQSLKTSTKEQVSQIKDVDAALDKAIGSLPKQSQEAARALRDQALAQFQSNRELKIAAELNKKAEEVSQAWRVEMDRSRGGSDEYAMAIQGLEKEYAKYGKTLEKTSRLELEQLATMRRELTLVLSITRARQVLQTTRERTVTKEGQERPPWIDLGGGSTVGGEPSTTTRDRVVTVEEQVARERLRIFHDRMRSAAANVTSILDRAIYDGLTGGGVKGGLASLGQGLLDIVQRFFLARLEEGLFKLFSDLGSKGGIWGTIFGTIGGGLGGGIGAIGGAGGAAAGGLGSVFAGAFASGGTIPMGQWGLVHEGERVKSTPRGAEVIPSGRGSGGGTVIMNVYANDARSFQSRDTQAQISRQLTRLQQKAALTG